MPAMLMTFRACQRRTDRADDMLGIPKTMPEDLRLDCQWPMMWCGLAEQHDRPKPSFTCYFTIQPIPSGWVIMSVRRAAMTIVKLIDDRPLQIGGEQHTGWLPAGAATPLPTPVRVILLNVQIEFDGYGYLLCYSSSDGSVYGDTWHESLADAEHAAKEYFGIDDKEWRSP